MAKDNWWEGGVMTWENVPMGQIFRCTWNNPEHVSICMKAKDYDTSYRGDLLIIIKDLFPKTTASQGRATSLHTYRSNRTINGYEPLELEAE